MDGQFSREESHLSRVYELLPQMWTGSFEILAKSLQDDMGCKNPGMYKLEAHEISARAMSSSSLVTLATP